MVQVINTKYPVRAYAESRIGGRAENQDTCAWTDTPVGLLILVCDGMGGGPGGKTASMIAAKVITDRLKWVKDSRRVPEELAAAIDLANAAILAASGLPYPAVNGREYTPAQLLPEGIRPQLQLKGMGSTVAAILINKDHAVVAHVGDSRIYQLRGKKIVYRSTDHSHVMELVKSHVIDEEQARLSGESNIITQALGHASEPLKSEVTTLPYLKGDRFVLCSDGIWGMFPQRKLIDMVAASPNGAGAVDSVTVSVDNEGISHGGGHDNLTIAVADVSSKSKDPVKMTRLQKILMYGLAIVAAISIIINLIQWHYRPAAPAPTMTVRRDTVVKKLTEVQIQETPSSALDENKVGELADDIADLKAQLDSIAQQIKGLTKIGNLNERAKQAREIANVLDKLIPVLKDNDLPYIGVGKAAEELRKPCMGQTGSDGQVNAIDKIFTTATAEVFKTEKKHNNKP
ncbi:MAG: serine/threonine-protein phosphatase [Pseudoflavonifractor sp.]|nr:serine/threonine-protein phosphatase [Alloprevotella sp.]MCM1116863.1 serine/threonine-protein phosphatase [Pseudoflavonifractor sp.]